MEILRAFAGTYVRITINLDIAITALESTDIWCDPEHREALKGTLESLGELTIPYELPVTRHFVDKILLALTDNKHTANNLLFIDYIHQLRNSLVAELGTKLFFQMPTSKALFFDSPWAGWEEIKDRFHDTATDIEEMSKCFAFSRYAGCVFHSLLVVERGLIDLGREIGVTNPKLGWDATCGMLPTTQDVAKCMIEGRTPTPEQASAWAEANRTATQAMIELTAGIAELQRSVDPLIRYDS